MKENTKEYRRDIAQWARLLLNKLWLLALAAAVVGAAYGILSYEPTRYTATTQFYIMDDGGRAVTDNEGYMEQWAYTVDEMIRTRSILQPLAEKCGESADVLSTMLRVDETEAYSVIEVGICSNDEALTQAVAKAVAEDLADLVNAPLERMILRPLDNGQYHESVESGLSVKKTVIVAVIAAVVCAVVLLIADMIRFPLMDERDLAAFSAPVLVSVPKNKEKEKYRLLCAKLNAFEAEGCRVIGVSGAVRDEGTEQTADGLTAAFAEAGACVQCLDLRAREAKTPELKKLFAERKQGQDCLIVKLPPLCRADATELSDALNGIVMTACCGESRVREMAQAADDFRYMKTGLLGFVLTKAPKDRT